VQFDLVRSQVTLEPPITYAKLSSLSLTNVKTPQGWLNLKDNSDENADLGNS
jgi:hypothetical protein